MKLALEYLPPNARELIDLVGFAAAMRFIKAYGGRTLEVAHGKRAPGIVQIQELSEVVGATAAKKIVARYKGTPLRVPKCYRAGLAMRDQLLQARFDELLRGGYSARKAVQKMVPEFDRIDRTIWSALKRPAGEAAVQAAVADDVQMGLFA